MMGMILRVKQIGLGGTVELISEENNPMRKYSSVLLPSPGALYTRQRKEAAAVVPEASGHFLNSRWGEMFMVLLMEALGNVEQQGTRSGCV